MQTMHNPTPKYVILRSLEYGTKFFSFNSSDDPRVLNDGSVGYEIIGYAGKVREAQMFLYGYSSCDHDE